MGPQVLMPMQVCGQDGICRCFACSSFREFI